MLKLKHNESEIVIKFWHGIRTKKQLLKILPDNLDFYLSDYINNRPDDFKRICSVTEIFLNDRRISIGLAICHPKDNFNKSYGRKLSFANALWVSDFSKLERRGIWRAYHEMCNKSY